MIKQNQTYLNRLHVVMDAVCIYFAGFAAWGIGLWLAFQTFINMGVNIGLLPTKGLTLPLISYGGSSLLIMSTAIMFLLRIDYETRLEKAQAFTRGSR